MNTLSEYVEGLKKYYLIIFYDNLKVNDPKIPFSVKYEEGTLNITDIETNHSNRITFPFVVEKLERVEQRKDHYLVTISVKEKLWEKSEWTIFIPNLKNMKNLYCRFCLNVLIVPTQEKQIEKVQSMPSEHWEELKDMFWVCACNKDALVHSPVLGNGPIRALENRILFGNTYLLVHSSNLKEGALSLQNSETNTINYQTRKWVEVNCGRCESPLGHREIGENDWNVKLMKHGITTVPEKENNVLEKHDLETFISTQLHSLAKAHLTCRFVVKSEYTNKNYVLLLITNWNSLISTNVNNLDDTKELRPTIKVSFIDFIQSPEEAQKCLDNWTGKYQVDILNISDVDCFTLLSILHQRHSALPESKRFGVTKPSQSSWLYYLYD